MNEYKFQSKFKISFVWFSIGMKQKKDEHPPKLSGSINFPFCFHVAHFPQNFPQGKTSNWLIFSTTKLVFNYIEDDVKAEKEAKKRSVERKEFLFLSIFREFSRVFVLLLNFCRWLILRAICFDELILIFFFLSPSVSCRKKLLNN